MTELLIKKAIKGDHDAFCRLMDLQTQSMYKIARAYLNNDEDVADAISETILSCYEKLPTLKHPRYFKTWLTRILINKCKDMLRTGKQVLYTDKFTDIPMYEENYDTAEWNQMLNSIEEKYRTILLLYYMEGFRIREIAQILDMNENTVKSRLLRGREMISQTYLCRYKEV